MQPSKDNYEDTPTKGQWQWQSNSNPNPLSRPEEPQWISYSPEQNFLLEKAYFDQQKEVDLGDFIVSLQEMLQKKKDSDVSQRAIRRVVQPEAEDIELSERDFQTETPTTIIRKEVENLEDASNLFSRNNLTSQANETKTISKGQALFGLFSGSGNNFTSPANEPKSTNRGQGLFGFSGNNLASQSNKTQTTGTGLFGLPGSNLASQPNKTKTTGTGLFGSFSGNNLASQPNEAKTSSKGQGQGLFSGDNLASQPNKTKTTGTGFLSGSNIASQPNETQTPRRGHGIFGSFSGNNLASQPKEAKTSSKGQGQGLFSGENLASQPNETKTSSKGQGQGLFSGDNLASQPNKTKTIGTDFFGFPGSNLASQPNETQTPRRGHGIFGSFSGNNLASQPNEAKISSKESQPNKTQMTGSGLFGFPRSNLASQPNKTKTTGTGFLSGSNLASQPNEPQTPRRGHGIFGSFSGNNPASQPNEPQTTNREQGLFGLSRNSYANKPNEMNTISNLFSERSPPDLKVSRKANEPKDMNKGVWQWKSNAEWEFYSFDHNELIEEAYQKDKDIEIQNYIISPIFLTQTEKANPEAVRPIRRIGWTENEENILLEEEFPKRIDNGFGNLNNFLTFIKGREIGNFTEEFEGIEASNDIAKLNQEIVPQIRICFQNEVYKSSLQKPSESNISSLIGSLKVQAVLSYEEKILVIQNILKFKMEEQCRNISAVFGQDLNTFHDFYVCILKAYTMGTFLYRNLNRYLREETWNQLHDLLPYLFCFCKAFFSLKKELQKELEAQPPQAQDYFTLYRGTRLDKNALDNYDPKTVESFSWNSIISTTSNIKIGKKFVNQFSPKDQQFPVLFKIETPITEKELEYLRYLDVKAYSAIPKEEEFILPPGSAFELQKVYFDETQTIIIEIKLKTDIIRFNKF